MIPGLFLDSRFPQIAAPCCAHGYSLNASGNECGTGSNALKKVGKVNYGYLATPPSLGYNAGDLRTQSNHTISGPVGIRTPHSAPSQERTLMKTDSGIIASPGDYLLCTPEGHSGNTSCPGVAEW
jgi:hypothetical protein